MRNERKLSTRCVRRGIRVSRTKKNRVVNDKKVLRACYLLRLFFFFNPNPIGLSYKRWILDLGEPFRTYSDTYKEIVVFSPRLRTMQQVVRSCYVQTCKYRYRQAIATPFYPPYCKFHGSCIKLWSCPGIDPTQPPTIWICGPHIYIHTLCTFLIKRYCNCGLTSKHHWYCLLLRRQQNPFHSHPLSPPHHSRLSSHNHSRPNIPAPALNCNLAAPVSSWNTRYLDRIVSRIDQSYSKQTPPPASLR